MHSSDRVVRSRAMRGASLCYLWLVIGFTLGTVVLLWPVHWLTTLVQQAGGSQGVENALAAYARIVIEIPNAVDGRPEFRLLKVDRPALRAFLQASA